MRPRLVLFGVISVAGSFVLGVVALHALIGKHDTWSAPVQAISTLALVAITGWYAYTTYKLLETQRSSHRRAAEESALRDLSRFISRQNEQVWSTREFFPAGPPKNPPMLLDVFACRDAFKTLRNQLLEFVEITPREVALPALGAAAHILNAEEELHALGAALTAETEAKYPGRRGLGRARRRHTERHQAMRIGQKSSPVAVYLRQSNIGRACRMPSALSFVRFASVEPEYIVASHASTTGLR